MNDTEANAAVERTNDENSVLQFGDAFALEVVTPADHWHDEQGRHASSRVLGFVGAGKSTRQCFCDFTARKLAGARDGVGNGRPPNPEQCRFVLATPNQYHASKALQRWTEGSGRSHDEGEALKRDAAKEKIGNRAVRRANRGKPALYGSVYQFEHSTGDFLDLKKQIATEDPAALRCGLASPDNRTKHTWFRILPGFRARKEGEPVHFGDTVVIQSMKKSQELHLHVGRNRTASKEERRVLVGGHEDTFAPDKDCRVELNLSPETDVENSWRTQFRIVPVAKYSILLERDQNDYVVRGGDYMELYHMHSQAYLSVDMHTSGTNSYAVPRLFRPLADSAGADPQSTISAELVWKIMIPRMAWSGNLVTSTADVREDGYCLNAAMVTGQQLFLAEDDDTGTVLLSDNPEDRLAQWKLQPFDDDTESGMHYDESKFFLVNVQSGKVLHQGSEQQTEQRSADNSNSACFDLHMLDPSEYHERDVFVLHGIGMGAAAREWIDDFQTGEEGLGGMWRFYHEMETYLAVRKCVDEGQSPQEQNTVLPYLSNRLREHQHESATTLALVASRRILDVKGEICQLWKTHVHPPAHHWNDWASPVLSEIQGFIGNLVSGSGDDPLQWMGTADTRQQNILRGLGFIKFIMHLLQAIYEILGDEEISRLRFANERGRMQASMTVQEDSESLYNPKTFSDDRYILLLVRGCFHLLHCMVKDNTPCALELFVHQDFLFKAIGNGFGVTTVVSEMFEGTPQLLQSGELTKFVNQFWGDAARLRAARFAQFLQQICFDENGNPLESNQCDVVAAIRTSFPADLFYETPSSEAAVVVTGDERAPDHRTYLFNLGMIELASATCAGHMQDGLDLWLQDVPQFNFSYEHILSKIADPDAHCGGYRRSEGWEVRRVYVRAMRNMYVDRQDTNVQKHTRQKSRIWPGLDVRNPAVNIDPRPAVGPVGTPGFVDLKTALNKALEDTAGDVNAAEIDRNRFILEILDLIQFMIRQGYYDPRAAEMDAVDDGVLLLGPELHALVPLLVSLMDGRADVGYIGRRQREHLDVLELEQLEKPGSSSRFDLNHNNLIVMSLKHAALRILNDLFGIQSSSRLSCALQQLADHLKGRTDEFTTDVSLLNGKAHVESTEEQEEHAMQNPLAIAPSGVATFEVEDGSPAHKNDAPSGDINHSVANGGIEIKTVDARTIAAAQAAAKSALKADDKFQKESRIFSGKFDDEYITEVLLDGLRYRHKTNLVLSSFAALYNFRAENTRFHELLVNVTLLATDAEALLYLKCNQLVTSYQRAVQRLLEEDYVNQCMTLAEEMASMCEQGLPSQTATARLLLRNLEIDEHLATMMQTHPNDILQGSYFKLLQNTLNLVCALCADEDEASQRVFAGHMESTLLPLFEGGHAGGDPQLTHAERQHIMLLVAGVLPKLISGNRELSISFAKILVSKTVEAIRMFGKHHVLLNILHVLVQARGKSVEYSQTQVSKGLMEKSSRTLDCALDEDEWEEGSAMGMVEVIVLVMRGDGADGIRNRAQQELKYYCGMVKLMGLCARGMMPHTELQAASMLSFERAVHRISNLFVHPDFTEFHDLDQFTEVKRSTIMFFNDVFIDSDTEFVETSRRQRLNGLWAVPHHQSLVRKPIAELFCDDIERLDAYSSEAFRSYVMAELCDFFILFAVGNPREDLKTNLAAHAELAKVDEDAKMAHMCRAMHIAHSLLTSTKVLRFELRDDERSILEHMHSVLRCWVEGEELPTQLSESLRRSGANLPDRATAAPTPNVATTAWEMYLNQFNAEYGVDTNTSSATSAKLLAVARDIVKDIPDDFSADARYSGALFKAIDPRIETAASLTQQDIPGFELKVLNSILEVIRAVPFTVHGDEIGLSEAQILENYLTEDDSIFANPSISTAESQILLVQEGWGLLCWKILSVQHLRGLHLSAVRLLSTLVSGGNYDVQTRLHEDLTDRNKCARELLGSSSRRIFDNACTEFRLLRKRKHGSPQGDTFDIAARVLDVLGSSCMLLHRGFQDYIPTQPSHEETFLLVQDVIELVAEIDRELCDVVGTDDKQQSHAEGRFQAYSVSLIDMFESAIRLLVNLVSGPHKKNALMVASSGIFMVLTRVMKYAKIESLDHIKHLPADDPSPSRSERVWSAKELMRCRLSRYSTELMLALLEGKPEAQVVLPICQTMDFQTWALHMRTLKSIIEGRTSFGTVPVALRDCAWVKAQSFSMITIVEKLVAFDLPKSALVPLMTVLKQKPLLEFFRARLGHASVVRGDTVESLYFDLALLPSEMTDENSVKAQILEHDVESLLDAAYDEHGEDIGRLSVFFEGVIEHLWQIDRDIEIAPHIDGARSLANKFVVKRLLSIISTLRGKWTLLVISLFLNITLLLSLEPSDDGDDTYGRWPRGENTILYLSRLHLVASCMHVVHFVVLRNPVLAKANARQKMIRKLARAKSKRNGAATYTDFVSCTVHVKDLPRGVTEAQIHQILGLYGEIQNVQVWGSTSKTSDALVCFLQEDSVDRVSEARVEAPASLWKQHSYFGRVSKTVGTAFVRHSSNFTESKDARRMIDTSRISLEQAKRCSGLFSEQLALAARKCLDGDEQNLSISDQVKDAIARGRNTSSKLQGVFNVAIRALQGPEKGFDDDECGFVQSTSQHQLFSFRWNRRFHLVSLDLFFSLLGYWHNDLFFAYHLLHTFKLHSAKIVMRSLTRNFTRLVLTILLAFVSVYIMAIFGYTQIREDHLSGSDDGLKTGNPGGACSTLMTCFVSYAFAGFTQTGLIYWLKKPVFPEEPIPEDFWDEPGSVFGGHGLRLLFEMLFMVLITTVVVAIVTGIIVDTFSELRARQENALTYRKTTCFVTGVSFQSVPEQKATSYMQYVFLVAFLRRKAHKAASPLTPLEQFVATKIDRGDTSWVPSLGQGHVQQSLDLRSDSNERTETEKRLALLEKKLSNIVDRLEAKPHLGEQNA